MIKFKNNLWLIYLLFSANANATEIDMEPKQLADFDPRIEIKKFDLGYPEGNSWYTEYEIHSILHDISNKGIENLVKENYPSSSWATFKNKIPNINNASKFELARIDKNYRNVFSKMLDNASNEIKKEYNIGYLKLNNIYAGSLDIEKIYNIDNETISIGLNTLELNHHKIIESAFKRHNEIYDQSGYIQFHFPIDVAENISKDGPIPFVYNIAIKQVKNISDTDIKKNFYNSENPDFKPINLEEYYDITGLELIFKNTLYAEKIRAVYGCGTGSSCQSMVDEFNKIKPNSEVYRINLKKIDVCQPTDSLGNAICKEVIFNN